MMGKDWRCPKCGNQLLYFGRFGPLARWQARRRHYRYCSSDGASK